MKKGLSTYLFVDERLALEQLKAVQAHGFDALEIFALRPHFDYRDKKLTSDLASWLTDQNGFLQSLHTPFSRDYQARFSHPWLSIGEPERIRREQAVDEIRRALEFAEKVAFPLAVVHMGAPEDDLSPRRLDAIYYSLETLIPFARDRGVRLALENIPNRLSRLAQMRRFVEEAGLREVGICFDVGHAHLASDPASEINDGGPWIVSTHVHDNDGKADEHLLPFEGGIEWPRVLEAFESIQYQGNWVVELKKRNRTAAEVLKLAGQCFDRFKKCQEELLAVRSREG